MFEFPTLNFRQARASRPKGQASSELPLYSPIAADHLDDTSVPPAASSTSTPDLAFSDFTETDHPISPADPLRPAQRHAASMSSSSSSSSSPSSSSTRPSLSRFLADFTLGFADGLTVPFALTAGLSSLGQTDTVIYAGLAEICAGSISMGIGGYLSAKGKAQEACSKPVTTVATAGAGTDSEEKMRGAALVEDYLAPLDLPPELLGLVRQHVFLRSDVASILAQKVATEDGSDDGNADDVPPSSIMVGLSVAIGYLIGGSLPLFPYFVVSHVGDGLMWSFIVCVIALFSFGFAKDFILHWENGKQMLLAKDTGVGNGWGKGRTLSWVDIRRSAWEGLLMVMLGSIAAVAAVLCVRLFEGLAHQQPQS